MYPAIFDIVTAVLAPFLILAIWKRRGFFVWSMTVIYFTISIVDHCGAFITLSQLGEPTAFKEISPDDSGLVVPAIQTTIDLLFMVLLHLRKYRSQFFKTDTD